MGAEGKVGRVCSRADVSGGRKRRQRLHACAYQDFSFVKQVSAVGNVL